MPPQTLERMSKGFFIDPEYRAALERLGLTDMDGVFSFSGGQNLSKPDLAQHRSRISFHIGSEQQGTFVTAYLKRYEAAPIIVQVKNWICHRRLQSLAQCEFETARDLQAVGIGTPQTIAYGWEWGLVGEKKSFVITRGISNAQALERRLPDCFAEDVKRDRLQERRSFIAALAGFVRKFHAAGWCHRDLYLSHIFYDGSGRFYLIDLARAFRPLVLRRRYRIKDIAQLFYSAPGRYFTRTDRLRFYLAYVGRRKLNKTDKALIRRVLRRAIRMARHDERHGRQAPFAQ